MKLKRTNQYTQNQSHHNNLTTQHTFFKRIENITTISFTNEELELLNKGLKYNLHKKPKTWIKLLH
jgi:hypothetical protein